MPATATTRARAWFAYDWGNSAFATVCMTALLPPYLAGLVNAELGAPRGTQVWAWTAAAGLLVGALIAPPLGAWADARGMRTRLLGAFALGGALAAAAIALVLPGSWRLAAGLYVVAATGFFGANVFYDGLLPGLGPPSKWDSLSARGYAWGYAGGGIALVLAALLAMSGTGGLRWAFVLVGCWWAAFTLPVLLLVPEPPVEGEGRAWARLRASWRDARQRPALWRFLLAYWVYSDGIGTVIKMAGAYGAEVGVPLQSLLWALVLAQAVGVPATVAFAGLARRIGVKAGILVALAGYVVAIALGYFMSQTWHFFALAVLVGGVQGGAQALSRSFYARLVPTGREAEYFAFLDVSGRMAGVLGPVLFAVVAGVTGTGRAGILAVVVLFIVGGWLLLGVGADGDAASA